MFGDRPRDRRARQRRPTTRPWRSSLPTSRSPAPSSWPCSRCSLPPSGHAYGPLFALIPALFLTLAFTPTLSPTPRTAMVQVALPTHVFPPPHFHSHLHSTSPPTLSFTMSQVPQWWGPHFTTACVLFLRKFSGPHPPLGASAPVSVPLSPRGCGRW